MIKEVIIINNQENLETSQEKKLITSKKQRISAELTKIKKLYNASLSDIDMKRLAGLLENAAFMRVMLKDLKDQIILEGYSETYNNGGGQIGRRESITVKTYNSTLKNYNATIKNIYSLTQCEVDSSTDSKLLDFIKA